MSQAEAMVAPDQAIRAGSKSFSLASRLFPSSTRHLVWDLYAWCRYCDDVTDGQVSGHGRAEVHDRAALVAGLRRLSDLAVAGDGGGHPVFAGLARVVAATGLPTRYVHDHLAGFEMDAAGCAYETIDDTLSYCYHVAGAVGLMMAWIMGVRDHDALLRGCDLGIAFQLTNIARDVNDDAISGRVYLPAHWLRDAGARLVPGEPLAAEARQAVVPVVARLLDEADRYYASASYGVAALPWRSAWAVVTARRVYAEIGDEVRRLGASAWDARVSTSRARKAGHLLPALAGALRAVAVPHRSSRAPRLGLWTPPTAAVLGSK